MSYINKDARDDQHVDVSNTDSSTARLSAKVYLDIRKDGKLRKVKKFLKIVKESKVEEDEESSEDGNGSEMNFESKSAASFCEGSAAQSQDFSTDRGSKDEDYEHPSL